jgi:hypothetical protein
MLVAMQDQSIEYRKPAAMKVETLAILQILLLIKQQLFHKSLTIITLNIQGIIVSQPRLLS